MSACLLWLLVSVAAVAAEPMGFTTRPLAWQQYESALSFHFFLDRELYTNLDRSARLVLAAESEKAGHKLADLSVRWSIRRGEQEVGGGQSGIEQGGVDVTFALASLPVGEYHVQGQLLKGQQVLAEKSALLRHEPRPAPADHGRVGLQLPRGMPLSDQTWPIHVGVPMPKGALRDAAHVRVLDAAGREVDADVLVRGRWGHDEQDSIRWLGVLMQAGAGEPSWPDGKPAYTLEFGPQVRRAAPAAVLRVVSDDSGVTIDTGAATFNIRRQGFNVIDQWRLSGGPSLQSTPQHGLYLVDHEGHVYRAANDPAVDLRVEEQSAMHVVVRASGWYVRDGAKGELKQNLTLPTDKLCRFVTRIEAYAGKPTVRVMNTMIITFDSFNVRLRDAGLSLPAPGEQGAIGATFGVLDGAAVGGAVPAGGLRGVQHLFNAYSVEDGDGRSIAEARHSAGWVVARGGGAALAMSLRDTWQRYPKEFEVLPDSVKLHIWPAHNREQPQIVGHARDQMHKLYFAHTGKEMNLRTPWDYLLAAANYYQSDSYGVYKPVGHVMSSVHASGLGLATTSDVMLELGPLADEQRLIERAEVFQLAPHAVAEPRWTCDSLALGYIHPYDPVTFPSPEQIIHDAMRGYWRYQDMGEMFGMWIYRSWLHSGYRGDGNWEIYRLYNGTHHHEAIIPWLLYARSGDPFYLTQGMANIRQLTDAQTFHHFDERSTHKDFHAHQRPIVGSTMHTNSLAPWGSDHGIMGHLVCNNAAITAYYLTGDLRLREVVVDEWLNTLLADRLTAGVVNSDRSNTKFPQNPRDNSIVMSEVLDAYQLTYDPRLLVYMAPRHDIWLNSPGCMGTDWGQPLHHELLFRGTRQTLDQLMAGVALLRQGKSVSDQTVARPLHATQEMFAVAGIHDPQGTWAFDAFSMMNYGYIRGWAWNRLTGKVNDVFSNTGEFVLFLPRMMHAVARSSRQDAVPVIGAAQSAPRSPSVPIHVVVREDADQEFKIFIHGKVVQESGFDIQVFDPAGTLVKRQHVEPGIQAMDVAVPSDGKTGQYVVFIDARQKDLVNAPFTRLPEVYVTNYWSGNNDPQRYFTRSPDATPVPLAVQPHMGQGTVLAADQVTELAGTESGEKMELAMGPQGVWIWNRTCYVATLRGPDGKQPVILAVDPQRWFMPDERCLSAKPQP